jgi:hypothetical protein
MHGDLVQKFFLMKSFLNLQLSIMETMMVNSFLKKYFFKLYQIPQYYVSLYGLEMVPVTEKITKPSAIGMEVIVVEKVVLTTVLKKQQMPRVHLSVNSNVAASMDMNVNSQIRVVKYVGKMAFA